MPQIKTGSKLCLFLCLLVLTGCSALPHTDRPPEASTDRTQQQRVRADSCLVAAANPYATQAGKLILQQGGNAVDAAIAVNMVLTLVEPQSSGLGGGSFILFWDKATSILHTYDGRESAPKNAGPELFYSAGKPLPFQRAVAGGRAVGVPGLLKNLELAHRRHGHLPWADLFHEAIRLAENGFIVSPRLSQLLAGSSKTKLLRNDQARAYFYPEGKPLTAGQLVKNRPLAQTFRQLASRGADAFYSGEIARHIVQAVRQDTNPGGLTLDDLANYRALERDPVCGSFFDHRVCGMGPPSSCGITLLQMLALLERTGINRQQPASPQTIHLFAQAGRLAFADRALYIADPDQVAVPTNGLLDPLYLAQRARLIPPEKDAGPALAGIPDGRLSSRPQTGYSPEQPGTSHMSIIDRYGNALSQTASIEQGFGCGLMIDGFLLNNELTDFSFAWQNRSGHEIANRVAGGKRPRSSMAPTMVFNENSQLKMVIGSPGGSRIIPYVAQTIVGTLVWQQDIQTAINQPHFLHMNGATLELEAGTLLEEQKAALEERGYRVKMRDLNSGLHGIMIDDEGLEGGADPRREGLVSGQQPCRTKSLFYSLLKRNN